MKKKYPDQIKQFGDKVRELRLSLHLTQLQLAGESGVDTRTIQRIEGGGFAASLNIVFALAQVLKVNPYELLLHIEMVKKKRTPVLQKK